MSERGTLRCQRCYGTASQHSRTCALVSARVYAMNPEGTIGAQSNSEPSDDRS